MIDTHILNDLKENNAQEAVDLDTLFVCAGHLGLHSSGESARSFERTSNNEDTSKEKPEMSVFGRERVRAIIAVILRHNLNDCEDEFDQWILEDLRPGTLIVCQN